MVAGLEGGVVSSVATPTVAAANPTPTVLGVRIRSLDEQETDEAPPPDPGLARARSRGHVEIVELDSGIGVTNLVRAAPVGNMETQVARSGSQNRTARTAGQGPAGTGGQATGAQPDPNGTRGGTGLGLYVGERR